MIDTSQFAFGKGTPGRPKASSCRRERTAWGWRYADGREVCLLTTAAGKAEYKARVEAMWQRQGRRCELGGETLALEDATFDHGRPRGMGAGFRDDRIMAPGNCAACGLHNSMKGSKRVRDLY